MGSINVKALVWLALAGVCLRSGFPADAKAESTAEHEGFRRVVEYHCQQFPSMEIQDLYKFVFQAALGSEHAVPNREAAQLWLERELATLSAVADEPLSEPLSPDGTLVRVNLRAFVARGGDEERLLDAFVQTAGRFEGSEDRLERYWGVIEGMAASKEIPFGVTQVRKLWAEMEDQGFPAVHHSTKYRTQYQPAYRVVLQELLSSDAPTVTGQ